jgi:hypothetical protein
MNGRALLNLAFGIAVSAAVLCGFWHWFGTFGLVYGMPVLAICAIPSIDLLAGLPSLAARIALRRYEGRYYAFRGRQVDIDIDARATCWVSTADVRKILPSLPLEPVLQRLEPAQVREAGDPRVWRITPAALAAVLARSQDAEALRFRLWLETQVQGPARKRLERGMQIR